jgi:DNA-directed RNA polymerase specialized sigma24 family protein
VPQASTTKYRTSTSLRRSLPGGGTISLSSLASEPPLRDAPVADVLSVVRALDRLAARDAERARIVELRFFAGLSIEETAAALHVSPGTVMREWTFTKAWLRRTIAGPGETVME